MDNYLALLRLFSGGLMSASEFEHRYLAAFKNDTAAYQEDVYQVLDDLFSDVDAYCADPTLRGPNDLDDGQLLSEARLALRELEQLTTLE